MTTKEITDAWIGNKLPRERKGLLAAYTEIPVLPSDVMAWLTEFRMAADIFFTDQRAWSSSSKRFVDIIRRAIGKCHSHERSLVQILREAERIRCLGVNMQRDRGVQAALTERVLQAATDQLQVLRGDPTTDPDDIKSVEELVDTSQVHLREFWPVADPNRYGQLQAVGINGRLAPAADAKR